MSDAQYNEHYRLAALKELEVLDTNPEAVFDGLVKAAASVCNTPISLITLVDLDRQWFKANVGLQGVSETPREVAFCAHAIQEDGIFEVNDASTDPRFTDNPLVTAEPHIRFYAGATLRLSNGAHVGTLCVIDQKPRQLTAQQREILLHLSNAAVQSLEARRVTRKLAANEAQFRALSASSPLGVFRANANGACTYTNERWQTIFDLNSTDALGHGWITTLHPDDKNAVFIEWTRAATARSEFDMEFRIQHSNGTVVSVRKISRPIITEDGELVGHVGSVEDVSERVASRQALIEERRRLTLIIEGTGAGTWEWNIQTGEMRFNARWADMVGRTVDELDTLTILTWNDLVHAEDVGISKAKLDQHLSGENDVYDCELRLCHREGHWIWVHLRARVLTHTEDGKPEWMFGTQLDITKRKEQEQAIRKSEWLLAETGELADVGGWELDLITNRVHWTPQTCRIHGMPDNYQPQLEEAFDIYAPQARPVIRDVVERAVKDGRAWDVELPLVRTCGDSVWVRSVGHVEYKQGEPRRLIGAFQNITDRVVQRQALEHAHERINIATESGRIGVWDWDIASGELTWTPQMYMLYGLAEESKITNLEQWAEYIHPEDRASAIHALYQATESPCGGFDLEFRTVWPDGSMYYLRSSANITFNADGSPCRILGVNWDVTPLRTLSNKLSEQHELLHVTLKSIGDAVITTNSRGFVTWLNPVAEYMTGWLFEDATGLPLSDIFNIVHEQSREPVSNPVQFCLEQDKVIGHAGNKVLISRDGSEFGIEESAAPIRSNNGDLLGVVLVFHDVTERRRLAGEMQYRATHDSLTGLFNRSEFETRLQRTLNKAIHEKSEHALMYIDLDQFKLVNDACGHSQGDQLLIQFSKLINQTVREGDTLARLGGDEFGVILEYCSGTESQRLAQKICDSMDEFRFEHDNRRFRIGASVGLVPLDERWGSIESALQAADTSCLAAKDAGRNRVHLWFDTDTEMRARHKDIQWATRLEQAIDEDRFILYAQRIESLAAGHNEIHAEVLIRLRETDGNLISPNTFLSAAERFNLATRIDRCVLEKSLNALVQLRDITTTDLLFINLSGSSVSDRVFHKDAVQLLKSVGSDICQRICLEITETAAVTNISDATNFIEQVRALGVKIALDDFGSGASSFGYLKTLPVDILKIDGQFIRGVIDDPLDAAAVRCFADIARVMKLKTVAECIESKAVLDCLDSIGIDYSQGFYLHKPEPIEHVLRYDEKKLKRRSDVEKRARSKLVSAH